MSHTNPIHHAQRGVTDTAQGSHTSLLYSLSTELSEASMHAEELCIYIINIYIGVFAHILSEIHTGYHKTLSACHPHRVR